MRTGWSGPPPVNSSRLPSFFSGFSGFTVTRLQLSMTGMYHSFSTGLYAVGGQFLPPILPGQIIVTVFCRVGVTAALYFCTPSFVSYSAGLPVSGSRPFVHVTFLTNGNPQTNSRLHRLPHRQSRYDRLPGPDACRVHAPARPPARSQLRCRNRTDHSA